MKRFIKVTPVAATIIFLCLQSASANEIERKVLSNGLILLIKESHKAPVVAIEVHVKTGSATEYGYLGSGISHFVEHMLFKGTPKRPKAGDIGREIKSLGGYSNGFTSHDTTGFYIVVPSEHTNNALEILKDILTESLFDPAELEKERGVILKEIRLNRDNPSRYLSSLIWSNMFKAHNYRFPVIGHEDLFKKLKRDDLLQYYKTRYIPDNIVLSIVGNIDSNEIAEKAEDLFGDIERVSPPQIHSAQEPPQITNLEVKETRKLARAYISVGFHSVGVRDDDLFSLDVLAMILGQGEDSRLSKRLYKEKRLVYSIGSFNYTPKDPGIFTIKAVLEKANVEKTVNGILKEIERLKDHPITDKELKKAKNQVLSAYIFSRQTVQGQAGDLASGEVITGDYDFSKKYVSGIKAVNKKMLLEVARKYLTKENMAIIKLLPKEASQDTAASKRSVAVALPEIERFELENGLKVLLLEDRTLPIASLSMVGLGGLRTEDFKTNGISNLVSEVLLCGTNKRSEEDIFSHIEGLGAQLSSFSASNTFGLSASCLDKDLDLVLEVLSDVLRNPEFNQSKIEREKSVIKAAIRATEDNIYQSGMRTLKYVLFKNHPYRFQTMGRVSAVDGFMREQISDYYRTYYRPHNMVLAISGNINKKKVKEKINALLGRFEGRPLVEINPPVEKNKTRPRKLSRDIEKEQSLVLLGYLGTTVDNHDKYALQVLSSALSGINGRLSQSIREEKGLAYALDMRSIAGIERGLIIFYIGTTKENLEIAKNELFKEIETLRADGINDEELEFAKSELIGLHRIGLQRSQDVIMRAALDELYGLGFNNFREYEDKIRGVTKESVLQAARKYLNPNAYVLLMMEGVKQEVAG
ncbi:MAG: insulinase family protein [Candidatus Omnitrophica bacterium]|nr:insulinase family protein [Candidatus Omnitrophota bacterium]